MDKYGYSRDTKVYLLARGCLSCYDHRLFTIIETAYKPRQFSDTPIKNKFESIWGTYKRNTYKKKQLRHM